MTTTFVFAILGAATGSIYALSALGIVVVHRGSGVINFASGAVGMLAAYVFNLLRLREGWPIGWALLVTLLGCGALGSVIYQVVSIRRGSALSRVVICLAFVLVLQGFVDVGPFRLGPIPLVIPTTPIVFGHVGIGSDRIVLIGIAIAASLVLWGVLRFSRFGLAISASVDNPLALTTLGWSPARVAATTWAIGCASSGLAGVLIAPLFGVSTSLATVLLLPALASAVIGDLNSLTLTLVGAMIVGVLEAEVQRWVPVNGLGDAIPFGAVVLAVFFRGRTVPGRGFTGLRFPAVTVGARHSVVGFVMGLALVLCSLFAPISPGWSYAVTMTLAVGVVLASVVVLAGFAGQVSFAQWAIAGVGALAFCQFFTHGVPAIVAIPGAVVVGGICGMVIGLFGIRVRMMELAIVTLGLNVIVVALVFGNQSLIGGAAGFTLPTFRLFGLTLDDELVPRAFGAFAIVAVLLVALAVVNLRRGSAGRRFLSVRSNERAAAALGVNVVATKLAAFGLAGAIASLGGVLVILHYRTPQFSIFDVMTSVQIVAYAVIGGIGFVLGPIFGAVLVGASAASTAGVATQVLSDLAPGAGQYLTLLSGLVVLAVAVLCPDGVLGLLSASRRRLGPRHRVLQVSKLAGRDGGERSEAFALEITACVRRAILAVDDLSVSFGAVRALSGVSFTVAGGEVLGIIGANGAGKSVLIDAITGFVPAQSGSVRLDRIELAHLSATARARRGLVRTFQSLELFEDMNVLENLLVAAEARRRFAWATSLVRPGRAVLSAEDQTLMDKLGIVAVLEQMPTELPFGHRRLLALGRAMLARPSILLLDEPAASLDQHERAALGAIIDWFAALGAAIVLVEHDVDFVCAHSRRVIALDLGHLIAVGSPEEVRAHPRVVASYLGEVRPAGS